MVTRTRTRRGYTTRNSIGLVGIVYLLVGLYVAFDRDYITVTLLKQILSALLAVVLWPLVLLGIDMRIG